MNELTTSASTKEQRHVSITNAIIRLETIAKSLQNFVDELCGNGSPESCKAEETHPCFVDAINKAPSDINSISDNISEQIGRLRENIL